MRTEDGWPLYAAILLFAVIVLVAQPWVNVPLNDDWQYASVAKVFAETGKFHLNVNVAPAVVGQSILAFPVIGIFGFSHVALRIFTLVLSVALIVELSYLMRRGGAESKVRFVALAVVVANPIFLHLATTFMTEIYGYAIAFLAACIWYRGERRTRRATIFAALLAGFSFSIRQFCALVLPGLIIAEIVSSRSTSKAARDLLVNRLPEIFAWLMVIGIYLLGARLTHNVPRGASLALEKLTHPDFGAIALQAGIFLFYMTVFFLPFLPAWWRKSSVKQSVFFIVVLAATAGTALAIGQRGDAPATLLNATFPFLSNVFSKYAVGPITLSDVYLGRVHLLPGLLLILWVGVELVAIIASVGWPSIVDCVRKERNEIAIFGVSFAALSLIAVLLIYQNEILDRYHFPGLIGLSLSIAICFPSAQWKRLRVLAACSLIPLAIFSSLGVHDYFRWQEAREDVINSAVQARIARGDISAGYDADGWEMMELIAARHGRGFDRELFSRIAPYRVGVEGGRDDRVLFSRPVHTWLIRFRDIKLFEKQ